MGSETKDKKTRRSPLSHRHKDVLVKLRDAAIEFPWALKTVLAIIEIIVIISVCLVAAGYLFFIYDIKTSATLFDTACNFVNYDWLVVGALLAIDAIVQGLKDKSESAADSGGSGWKNPLIIVIICGFFIPASFVYVAAAVGSIVIEKPAQEQQAEAEIPESGQSAKAPRLYDLENPLFPEADESAADIAENIWYTLMNTKVSGGVRAETLYNSEYLFFATRAEHTYRDAFEIYKPLWDKYYKSGGIDRTLAQKAWSEALPAWIDALDSSLEDRKVADQFQHFSENQKIIGINYIERFDAGLGMENMNPNREQLQQDIILAIKFTAMALISCIAEERTDVIPAQIDRLTDDCYMRLRGYGDLSDEELRVVDKIIDAYDNVKSRIKEYFKVKEAAG